MRQSSRAGRAWVFTVFALILLGTSCSRPGLTNSPAQSDTKNLPFHQDAREDGGNQAEPAVESGDQGNQKVFSSRLPFATSAQDLPAGTLFTVTLETSISGSRSIVPQVFTAVIDEPVVVDGKTVIPRGTEVLGHIDSARASDARAGGYLSLILDSLRLRGTSIPLQTSNLFARGNERQSFSRPQASSIRIISLNKGRRLTFRLTSNVVLAAASDIDEGTTPSPASK